MHRQNKYFSDCHRYICFLLFMILSLLFSMKLQARVVWEAGLDYISLNPVEKGFNHNQHPVSLSATDVYNTLSAIRYRSHRSGNLISSWLDDDDNETFSDHFFVESELRKLAPAISRALALAKPDQDVVFSITGRHSAALGSKSLSSTGRIFFFDGAINIIIGEAYVDIEKRYRRAGLPSDVPSKVDMRELKNFKLTLGSRKDIVSDSIELTPYGSIERVNHRSDWVRVKQEAIAGLTDHPDENNLNKNAHKEVEQTRTTALENKVEQLEKRLDTHPAATTSTSSRSVEDRLAHLKALYEKGYVTKEIYEQKMQLILSDL